MPATAAAPADIELNALYLQARALPAAHRRELALRLLDELDDEEVSEAEAEAAWEEEIGRRLAEIDAGTAESYPVEEVLAELRARFG